jgi:hypothetical protein
MFYNLLQGKTITHWESVWDLLIYRTRDFRYRIPKFSVYRWVFLSYRYTKIHAYGETINFCFITTQSKRSRHFVLNTIHPLNNYIIWPGRVTLMNHKSIALHLLLIRGSLPGQKAIRDVIIQRVHFCLRLFPPSLLRSLFAGALIPSKQLRNYRNNFLSTKFSHL